MEPTVFQIIWFILITVLFIGFFFLEGFDYGVGMLLPFLGKNDRERRAIINTIGPVWDGNEVWLITAGGASFAAFPQFYATLFSGFFIALILMLIALIFRAVSFEFRSKMEGQGWRNTWDWIIAIASFLIALLWGVAVGNLIQGITLVPDPHFNGAPYVYYHGGFFGLLSPFTIISGLVFVFLFLMHGANFLTLKTTDPIVSRAKKTAFTMWIIATALTVIFVLWALLGLSFPYKLKTFTWIVALLAAVALLLVGFYIKKDKAGMAFIMGALTIVLATVMVFAGLYPNLIPAANDPNLSITIMNASSSPYTLKVMSIVAVILVPIVLLYQIWTYKVFKDRVSVEQDLEY